MYNVKMLSTSKVCVYIMASTFVGSKAIDTFPVALKNALHPRTWKKENMGKWKRVRNQVRTSKLTKPLAKAIAIQ